MADDNARLREQVLEALTEVAPDIGAEHLEPRVSFRDQYDFDSVDFLNFVMTLERRLGTRIPEADYPQLSTLDGAVGYLRQRP